MLIPIIVNGILGYLRQPKQAEKGKVYLPKFFAILGAIATGVFLIPTIITAFLNIPLWTPIFFLLFSLLSSTLIVGFINCRISYDEEGFVAKNFLGIKRKCTYDQVTAIKENMHESYIYIGKHRVMVDEFSIGGEDFIRLVKKKYRTVHNGQRLPQIYKTKYDLFNGNIKDAGSALFAYIMIAVLMIGLLIFAVVYTYFTPSTKSNTIEQSVSFVSCEIKKKEIVMTSVDDQIYVIRFVDERFNTESIQAICDGEKVVTAYSDEVTPDYEEDYYSVKAMVYNGNYLLSFEETNRLHRQESWPLIVLMAVMCLFWAAYIAGSIIVGRNPKKFSKRVIRLFFKDGYIKC